MADTKQSPQPPQQQQSPPHDGFVVAIVGGGVAGLAMALHMEKLGMDWILLESQAEMAPRLGASIGMHPSSMRVLDQLGVHDDLVAESGSASSVVVYDDAGRRLYEFELMPRTRATHGFDLRFTERSTLLRVMDRHLRSRDRVHTGQRVVGIEHAGDRVRISTEAGRVFEADLVVGADGIRSHVRGEMWRNARADGRLEALFGPGEPGAKVETEYGCVYGISKDTGVPGGVVRQIHTKDKAIAIMTREGIAYWFVFWKLDRMYLGLDLPRLTEEDEKRAVEPHLGQMIHPGITFGDVYKAKTVSVPAPLPTNFFNRWHYRRIVCVGDAVVKTQPIQGQGGGNAIESAVALVDCLYEALQANGQKKLSSEQVEAVLGRLAELRHKRCEAVVGEGLTNMRMSAWANWLYRIVDAWVIGLVPKTIMVDQFFKNSMGSYVSTTLPQPVRRFDQTTGEALGKTVGSDAASAAAAAA